MNNAYELEFDITHLIRQLLRTNTTTNTTDANAVNTTTDVSGNTNAAYLAMMQHNQNIIEELVYSYNSQMQRYHNNIERVIQMLQTNQNRIHQYMMLGHPNSAQTNEPISPSVPLYSPFRRNAIREDTHLVRSLFNSPNTLLYTYLFPRTNQERGNRNTVSAEQRATAIQHIPYDSHSMRETVCPISLLPFTQGEQISQIRHCMHIFKNDSLENWLTHYSSCCPVCRYDIRNYREPNTNAAPASQTAAQMHESFDYESDENDE